MTDDREAIGRFKAELEADCGACVELISHRPLPMSSTEIRERLRRRRGGLRPANLEPQDRLDQLDLDGAGFRRRFDPGHARGQEGQQGDVQRQRGDGSSRPSAGGEHLCKTCAHESPHRDLRRHVRFA